MEELQDKLRNLTINCAERNLFEPKLKSTIKEMVNLSDFKSSSKVIEEILKHLITDSTEIESIANALIILKAIADAPLPSKNDVDESGDVKGDKLKDVFWEDVIARHLLQIYSFLDERVFGFCSRRLTELSKTTAAGAEYHQVLGLLQKGVRTVLVYLKRGIDHPVCRKSVNGLGKTFCSFLNSPVDIGLEIRCNLGLALYYLLMYEYDGRTNEGLMLLRSLFQRESSIPMDSNSGLATKLVELAEKDVNRIGLSVGVLGVLDFSKTKVEIGELLYAIGKNVLDMDHGTKEAINLGTGRVLEMLTEKLSSLSSPLENLHKVAPLFLSMEIFVFTYIPGHIDAVKNCSKNILGSLTIIYDRINPDLTLNLTRKVMAQDDRVKWIGLSCIARNSKNASKILMVETNMPISLLSSPKTSKHPVIESYIALMSDDFNLEDIAAWEQRWLTPLFETQFHGGNWLLKRDILSKLLKSERTDASLKAVVNVVLKFVVEKINSISTMEDSKEMESTLLAAETLKTGSELVLKIRSGGATDDTFRGLISRDMLHSWIWSENPQIRLAAFSLLVETKKTSDIITENDFDSLKILLKYNLLSQSAPFRQQFMSYFKKFLLRLKDSQALLKRQKNSKVLKCYSEFLFWLWNCFTEEEGIFPGSNFGRRSQAIECLFELVSIFDNVEIFGVLPCNSNMKYLSWLTDSYLNNKTLALNILLKIPIPGFQEESTCENLFDTAIRLCESLKPPDSVTARYLVVLLMKKTCISKYSPLSVLSKLLFKLEDTFNAIISTSLTAVSCERPFYGLIRCIRMIVNETDDYIYKPSAYKEYFEKLINLFLMYDEVLFPILGHAAPEGTLPDLPDSSGDNNLVVRSITAQMLLVCSWRSMRDICDLFSDMCVLLPLEGEVSKKNASGEFILSFNQISVIGEHLLYLLKNLVHRGVFEQVYVGFKTLAARLWKSSNHSLCSLPSKWLNEAMDEEHMSAKCITRRSAGLPFIFQALLSAESHNDTFLTNWVQRLLVKEESTTNSFVRIHAINVIRGLFRDATFSSAMVPFVPDGLKIAFRGLKSQIWTERNAGLMLYGAVIRRTFGSRLNLMSAPTFFRKFPQMYDFLLDELSICLKHLQFSTKAAYSSEYTFHLLILLASFAPAGRVEDQHFKLSEFIPKLRQFADSPDSEVRKQAANAIIPFLTSSSDTSFILGVIEEMRKLDLSKTSFNLLHGNLLQLTAMTKYLMKGNSSIDSVIDAIGKLCTVEFIAHLKCPTILEAAANLILSFDNFKHTTLSNIYGDLTSIYSNLFQPTLSERNAIPGILVADSTIAKGEILFKLKQISETEDVAKIVNELLTEKTPSIVEQLIENLSNENQLLHSVFSHCGAGSKNLALVDTVMILYLGLNDRFVGQTFLEQNFLKLFTLLQADLYSMWFNANESQQSLVNFKRRLFDVCLQESATNEHKRYSMICLSKLILETNIEFTDIERTQWTSILIEWTDSSVDDDLRFGAAHSIPLPPFKVSKLTVMEKCKIWIAIFKLAQDDDSLIRSVINKKLSQSTRTCCDRRSLENLVSLFFETLVNSYPLEGLIVVLGLAFRDDFEILAEDSHDGEENRLFDKSEMNMYYEPITFAKTIKEYIDSVGLATVFQAEFHKKFNSDQSELYEIANNSKLFFCEPTLNVLINIVRMRLSYDQIVTESHSGFGDCQLSSSNQILLRVLRIVESTFPVSCNEFASSM